MPPKTRNVFLEESRNHQCDQVSKEKILSNRHIKSHCHCQNVNKREFELGNATCNLNRSDVNFWNGNLAIPL